MCGRANGGLQACVLTPNLRTCKEGLIGKKGVFAAYLRIPRWESVWISGLAVFTVTRYIILLKRCIHESHVKRKAETRIISHS